MSYTSITSFFLFKVELTSNFESCQSSLYGQFMANSQTLFYKIVQLKVSLK